MDIHDVGRREVLRYLGYRGQETDEAVTAIVEQFVAGLWEAAAPRHLYQEYPLALGEDYRIDGGRSKTRSRNLWGNLKDCDQIIVSAVALGCGTNHPVQKYSHPQMSRAMVMQAAAAAMIEEYCDQVCTVIKSEYKTKGRYLRLRFSPSYRDFPLECQGMLLETLGAGKRISIRPTDSLLMMPPKSVSAVMRASRKPYRCGVKGCGTCAETGCPYRR